jgi:predicted transposase YbfD/YdcC
MQVNTNNIDFEETFLKFFEDIDDPRRFDGNFRHSAEEILLVTLCAIIAGADSWRDLVKYGNIKLNFLKQFYPYEYGIPSKNTFYRFFAVLKPEAFKACFLLWVKSLKLVNDEIIAIDGKTLRRSHDKANEQKAIHMVSAFASKTGIVLGQEKVDKKSNEITAIPKLLDLLDIKGCIITIDAMGTQRKIAEQIINNGGDYILALKGNQSNLHKEVAYFLQDDNNQIHCNKAQEVDCGHGRIETRNCLATENIDWLDKLKFPGQKSIFCVESTREIGEKINTEIRYYIASVSSDAAKLNSATRHHWAIENCLHWTLDMTFNEDYSRIRLDNAAENMAMIRHTVLNLIKLAKPKFGKDSSLKGLRKQAGWDDGTLATILRQ